MIIYDLNVSGFIFDPLKADSPLIVYADAVLTRTASLKPLKPVSRRGQQVLQIFSVIQVEQFTPGGALDIPRQLRRDDAKEDLPRFF